MRLLATRALVLGALLVAAAACDTTSVPIDRANTDPGLVAGLYTGSADFVDQDASRFSLTLTPSEAGAPAGLAASSTGDLTLTGTMLRNSVDYEMLGTGQFDYPDVTINAKVRDMPSGEDSFTFLLTTDASGTVLQGTVNGQVIRLDRFQ